MAVDIRVDTVLAISAANGTLHTGSDIIGGSNPSLTPPLVITISAYKTIACDIARNMRALNIRNPDMNVIIVGGHPNLTPPLVITSTTDIGIGRGIGSNMRALDIRNPHVYRFACKAELVLAGGAIMPMAAKIRS